MLCLALGIGVNSSVFTMVNELFWATLPVPHGERVAAVGRTGDEMTCSYRDWEDIRRRASARFSGIAAFDEMPTSLDSDGLSQIVLAEAVSSNFAGVLQLGAQAGRWFTEEDERPG